MSGLTFSTAWVKTSIGSASVTFSLDDVQRVVEDLLRRALLAVVHQAIDELAGQERAVTRIRRRASCGWR